MKTWPGVYGMEQVFATRENFDRYMERFRALAESAGASVVWSDAPRAHSWTSGWVPEAVADPARMVPVRGS
jgi:hypothetical protein